jgi:DNA-binding transcriptional ArsR family regulator
MMENLDAAARRRGVLQCMIDNMRMHSYKTAMSELDPVFDAVAAYFSVLSEPTRLKIMHCVCNGEKTVSEIVAETGATQSNVSRHLGLMYRHGVLTRRRNGTQILYTVADPTMVELCRSVCNRIASGIEDRRTLRRQFLKLIPAAKKRAA